MACLELGNLTPADVISFVVARCPRQNSGVAKLTVTALRSFLGFLHLDGVTERSLVLAVPSVARRRLAGLPKGLEPDQVRAPSRVMRCQYSRRLPRSGDSDPAGPARPAARRSRRAQAGRYRLARGHDHRARQGQLHRTDAHCRPMSVTGWPNTCSTPGPRTPRAGPCSSGASRHITHLGREPCEHDRGGCRPAGRSRAHPCASSAPHRGNADAARRRVLAGDRPAACVIAAPRRRRSTPRSTVTACA